MYVVKRWKDCNKVRLRYNCLILAIALCWYVLLFVQEILFKLNKISWTYSIFQISSFKWRILPMWPYNYALYRMSNNSSSTFIVCSLYENGQDFWTYSMTFLKQFGFPLFFLEFICQTNFLATYGMSITLCTIFIDFSCENLPQYNDAEYLCLTIFQSQLILRL